MRKLYYIKYRCYANVYGPGESWTCDVTDSILEAHKLLKEYQLEDASGKYKISSTGSPEEVKKSWFNKVRYETYLT